LGVAAAFFVLLVGIAATAWQAIRARRAEAAARRQAEIATQVNSFVTGMLQAGDPILNPGGREITVREVVDRAASEMEATGLEWEIEAGIRTTLGMTYGGFGLYEKAERQLRRASVLQSGGESGPEEVATDAATMTELELARIEALRSRYVEAEERLARVEPIIAKAQPDAAIRSRFLALRGENLANLSHYAESDSLLSLQVDLLRRQEARARDPARGRSVGRARQELALALLDLCDVRRRLGRVEEAETLGREALEQMRAMHPEPHHDVASASGRLALILKARVKWAGAESLFTAALAIDREIMGPEHPWVAMHLGNLAGVWSEQGRLEEAERGLRECLALLKSSLGPDHGEVTSAMGSLATVLQQRGALEEAIHLRREVLAIDRRLYGETHNDVATALNNLGSTCRLMKRYAEAEAAFREAIGIYQRIYVEEHPSAVAARHNLGKTLLDAERPKEAEAPLVAAMEGGRRIFPAGHPNLGVIEASYGRMLAYLGRYPEAETALLAAHRTIASSLGPESARALETAGYLAALYAKWRKPEEARRRAAR
jgi:tetratricopeptide (TPR) repeat protein